MRRLFLAFVFLCRCRLEPQQEAVHLRKYLLLRIGKALWCEGLIRARTLGVFLVHVTTPRVIR